MLDDMGLALDNDWSMGESTTIEKGGKSKTSHPHSGGWIRTSNIRRIQFRIRNLLC